MADYALEALGDDDFQRLCQALLTKEFPGVQLFPLGQADGGRDAILFGTNKNTSIAFQVKYHNRPNSIADPHKWVLKQIEKERSNIARLMGENVGRYILMTNVSGTGRSGSGSIDSARALLSEAIDAPSECWWRDDILRRLDDAPDLHWAFPQLLTGADVLRRVIEAGLDDEPQRRAGAIRAYLTQQYEDDAQVRFKQVDLDASLLDLFVDVGVEIRPDGRRRRRSRQYLLAYQSLEIDADGYPGLLEDAPSERAPGAASLLLDSAFQKRCPQVVIEGAPGQGKSTLAQYLCQVHRTHLLGKDVAALLPPHRRIANRLPLKVDLRDLALWLRKENPFDVLEPFPPAAPITLEGFLAAQISRKSGGVAFDVGDLHAVLRLSTTLIVLDGLDEVADIKLRQRVVDEVTAAVQRLDANCLSLQAVITSRPAAFANSPAFSSKNYVQLDLSDLSSDLINDYAERWIPARNLQHAAAADVRRILKTKMDQPHMRDLARNPMQLTILLSLIHSRGVSLPDQRTRLYDSYIDTFFNREAEKAAVVREHRELLVQIHQYLAWRLHVEAEVEKTDGRIQSERLQAVLTDYLAAEGHDTELAESLFDGIVARVVALVSRVEGTYEFEVQPLREYFAARFLYETAPYVQVGTDGAGALPDRFEGLIRNRYWLNVARFLAGCFNKGELGSLLVGLQSLRDDPVHGTTEVPRLLARFLLADWVFSQSPRLRDQVVDIMMDPLGAQLLDRRRTRSTAAALPIKAGGTQVANKAFELLAIAETRELRAHLAQIVRANRDRDRLFEEWYANAQGVEGSDRTVRITDGLHLGVLHQASSEELDDLMKDEPLEAERLWCLLRAGHGDYCELNRERAEAIVRNTLDGRYAMQSAPRKALPTQGLVAAVTSPLSHFFYMGREVQLIAARDGEPDCITNARKVARPFLESESYSSLRSQANLFVEFERLLESGLDAFGDQWAWVPVASMAGGLRRRSELSRDASELFDPEISLAKRAAYARHQAGRGSWWQRQFDSARSRFDKQLVLFLFAQWSGPKAIVEFSHVLDSQLKALTSAEFQRLYFALRDSYWSSPYARRDLKVSDDNFDGLSPRAAAVLALRVDDQAATGLVRQFVGSYQGPDAALLLARTEAEIRPIMTGTSGADGLALLRRVFKTLGEDPLARISRPFANTKMSSEVSEEILARPLSYPQSLVSVAEADATTRAGRTAVPVGRIADEDSWFTAV